MYSNFFKRTISSIILLPAVFFIIFNGNYLFNIFLFLCCFLSIFEWIKLCKNRFYSVSGSVFLLISFTTAYFLRSGNQEFNSLEIFLLILILCIFTDIGGYVFGNTIKGPKLTKISPNKTISGVLGSYFLSMTFGIIFIKFHHIINLKITIYKLNLEFIILIFLISTTSQIGDIVISYFKRISYVKDTGKLIPGHGGILDRIDGMIFVFPAYYLINLII